MSASDPEDEICVMELIKRRKAAAAAASRKMIVKEEKNSDGKTSNGSKEKGSTIKKRKRKDSDDESSRDNSSSESDEEDDDDEKPIGQLIKKRKEENNKDINEKKQKAVKDESSLTRKIKTSSVSTLAKNSTEFYNETDKGKLVQRLLVRWWYAIVWPKPEEIGAPPPGYESLDGFPGVFICTRVITRQLLRLFLSCSFLSFVVSTER